MIFADLVLVRCFAVAVRDREPTLFGALGWRAVRLIEVFGMMVSIVWSRAPATEAPTTPSPQFAGHHHPWAVNLTSIAADLHTNQCFLCQPSPVLKRVTSLDF